MNVTQILVQNKFRQVSKCGSGEDHKFQHKEWIYQSGRQFKTDVGLSENLAALETETAP